LFTHLLAKQQVAGNEEEGVDVEGMDKFTTPQEVVIINLAMNK